MSSRFSPSLRPLLGLIAVLVVVSLGGFTRGQDELAGNNQDAVEKAFKKNKPLFSRLVRGEEPFDAKNKAQLDALDSAAKYVAYSLTWVTNEKERGKIDDVFREYEKGQLELIQRNKTQQQQELANAYTKVMIVRAREVLTLTTPIARINAARVLARLADLGQPELADALLAAFNQEIARPEPATPLKGGERNDGVVYYLLRGMRELLAIPVPAAPAKPVLSPERENKLAEALSAFITKAPAFTKETPAEEVEGYRSLRREAVHALAYSRAPGLKDKERPALLLLRVMARDGFDLEPRFDETVEAALGVARLRTEVDGKDYQPEYAAYQLALFVDYFAKYYMNFFRAPLDKTKVEDRPYRVYASRLLEALEAMKAAEAKNAYVAKTIDECRKLLTPVEKGELIKTGDLDAWLANNAPPKQSLFQGVAESTVKPANRETP